jgi:hypothetical protein
LLFLPSHERTITVIKYAPPASSTIMLSRQCCPELSADIALPKSELLEIHCSKISLPHAKASYSYPMIRLPHTLLKLAGLITRIYQTAYDGSLAFPTVISTTENWSKRPDSLVFTRRRSRVRIGPSPFTWASFHGCCSKVPGIACLIVAFKHSQP